MSNPLPTNTVGNMEVTNEKVRIADVCRSSTQFNICSQEITAASTSSTLDADEEQSTHNNGEGLTSAESSSTVTEDSVRTSSDDSVLKVGN